jgi:enoyl-CoA hydratase/carnithine racemase
LGARLLTLSNVFEASQRAAVWEVAHAIGIRDQGAIERMTRLHRATMRGLAMEMLMTGETVAADDAMALLELYKRHLTGSLLVSRP